MQGFSTWKLCTIIDVFETMYYKDVPISQTEIFLSLGQLRKVQLQLKKMCNSGQLHFSGRKVQLKCIFVDD
jgi:hypothetical protein